MLPLEVIFQICLYTLCDFTSIVSHVKQLVEEGSEPGIVELCILKVNWAFSLFERLSDLAPVLHSLLTLLSLVQINANSRLATHSVHVAFVSCKMLLGWLYLIDTGLCPASLAIMVLNL